jgi:hypothetical protein
MARRADLQNAHYDVENHGALNGGVLEAHEDNVEVQVLSWDEWQHRVLDTIQTDFHGVLDRIEWDDIDWDAWRPLFEQGASARDAVRNAFGKVV